MTTTAECTLEVPLAPLRHFGGLSAMAKPFTPAEIEALPPLLSINQASRLLLWDHGTLSKAVESGTFPVLAIDKGTRKVLPKQALMELLAGRRAGAA